LTRLKATNAVADIVDARIYGQAAPAGTVWPFVIWGAPTLIPVKASCVDGSEITVAIHGFAKKRMDGQTAVETAEDHASRLGAEIARALDGYRAEIETGTAAFRWTGGRLLIDGGEADAFHTVQNFRIRCITNRTG
jgi:hypothetical protein